MTDLLGHVIGRFDFETRSEQGSNRRPPISCPRASREVEGRLGAFYLARTPSDPLARHPLGKKNLLAIRLGGLRGEARLVSEASFFNSVARDKREVSRVAISFVTDILENFVSDARDFANKESELISVRALNKPLRDSLKNLLVEFVRLVNFFERRRHRDFVASRFTFDVKRVDFAREGDRREEFAFAQIPLLIIKNRVAYREFERVVNLRIYEVNRALLVALIVAFETRRGASSFNMERPNIKPQDAFSSRVYFFNHFAFLVFVARVIPIDAPSLIDFLGIGKKKIVIRQKKSRAFRLAIAPVGIRLARARDFLARFRGARFDALDFRRDDLRDLRAFFLRDNLDDLRAALASFPDSFEERKGAGEFLLHLRERVLFRDALRLKSVDHRSASEVIDFDRFRSFDFRSFHFAFLLFKVELFRPSKGLLVPSTLLVSIRREKVSTKENENSFASNYELARVELTSKLGSCHSLNYIHSPSRDFSTIGTRIIHSYNALGRAFIRREGKNSADSKTSFSRPSDPLGESSDPKNPWFLAFTGFSTKLINRISSFNSQRRGAAFRSNDETPINKGVYAWTYTSTLTSSNTSTLTRTLTSSISSTLLVNSVNVPITRT